MDRGARPGGGRRAPARSAGLVLSLLAWPAAVASNAHPVPRPLTTVAANGQDTLLDPPVLRNISHVRGTVEVNLTAAVVRRALKPGTPTEAYARMMDMARVDVHAPLDATEIWELENVVGMDHPFHLHGFQFQVLDRNGVPEPFRSWKDVVNVRKHESVRIIVRYDDFPGLWMYHCHILDHEDHGMMGVLEIRPPPPRQGS